MEEKNRFDGGDGVKEASNAVAAVEARESNTRLGRFYTARGLTRRYCSPAARLCGESL